MLVTDHLIDKNLLGGRLQGCLEFDLNTNQERFRPKMDISAISTPFSENINAEDTGRAFKAATIFPEHKVFIE